MKKQIITLFTIIALAGTASAQKANYQLSSHILDINLGQPAPGVTIQLSKMEDLDQWTEIAQRKTDQNGRVKDFLKIKGAHKCLKRLQSMKGDQEAAPLFPSTPRNFK